MSMHLIVSAEGAELIVKYSIGLVMAALTGLATKAGADIWTVKILPKVLKMFKNGKKTDERSDDQRAA